MNVEETDDFDAFASINASTWRRLAVASPVASVFQTWEWTSAWWRHFGQGKRPWLLRFVDDGEVVGFCALYLPVRSTFIRTARFIGTGVSDYLDLIAAPGKEDAVAHAFLQFLEKNRRRWDWLDLREVRPGSVASRLVGGSTRLQAQSWQDSMCTYAPLPSSWNAFRATLPKKFRQNLDRRASALERNYLVEYRLATAETLDADMDRFFELHQRQWNEKGAPGAMGSPAVQRFHKDVARALLEIGLLRLHVLSLDGETRATRYSFQKNNVVCGYLSGLDPNFAKFGLGNALMACFIRDGIEADGAREVDFLRGDETYKYGWGAQNRPSRRIALTHRGLRSTAPVSAVRTIEEGLTVGVHRMGLRPRLLAYRIRTSLSPTAWLRGASPTAPAERESADG